MSAMTTNDSTDHTLRAALADAAIVCQPRLFAIHGLYKRREQGPILGWGMQFPDDQGALFTDPSTHTTHRATRRRTSCGTCSSSATSN